LAGNGDNNKTGRNNNKTDKTHGNFVGGFGNFGFVAIGGNKTDTAT